MFKVSRALLQSKILHGGRTYKGLRNVSTTPNGMPPDPSVSKATLFLIGGTTASCLGFMYILNTDFRHFIQANAPFLVTADEAKLPVKDRSDDTGSSSESGQQVASPGSGESQSDGDSRMLKKQKERDAERHERDAEITALPKAEEDERQIALMKEEEEKQKAFTAEQERLRHEEERRAKEEALARTAEEAQNDNETLAEILAMTMTEARDSGEQAIAAHTQAAQAFRDHASKLKKALDETDQTEGVEGLWADVAAACDAARQAASEANDLELITLKSLEKLQVMVLEARDNPQTRQNQALGTADKAAKHTKKQLEKALANHNKAQAEFSMVREYQQLIREGRNQFAEELQNLHPDLKLGQGWGGRLTDEELEMLIAHAHKRIGNLQKQLFEMKALDEKRIEEAMARQKEDDQVVQEQAVLEKRRSMEEQFLELKKQWEEEAEEQREAVVQRELARQASAHKLHMDMALKERTDDLQQEFEHDMASVLREENDKFERKIAGSISRLRGIETAIKDRAELEIQSRKAQELWLACVTLKSSLTAGQEEVEGRRKPLQAELGAVREAGNQHPFVNAMVDAFPEEGATDGVWTQDALEERFQTVYYASRRLALVDETGGRLLKYFLSYLQSILTVPYQNFLHEQSEISAETSQLLLLDSARYYLKQGNLELAVKLVSQLRGPARIVASDWLWEARLTCEAKQATDCLLAHASAAGLGALF